MSFCFENYPKLKKEVQKCRVWKATLIPVVIRALGVVTLNWESSSTVCRNSMGEFWVTEKPRNKGATCRLIFTEGLIVEPAEEKQWLLIKTNKKRCGFLFYLHIGYFLTLHGLLHSWYCDGTREQNGRLLHFKCFAELNFLNIFYLYCKLWTSVYPFSYFCNNYWEGGSNGRDTQFS